MDPIGTYRSAIASFERITGIPTSPDLAVKTSGPVVVMPTPKVELLEDRIRLDEMARRKKLEEAETGRSRDFGIALEG